MASCELTVFVTTRSKRAVRSLPNLARSSSPMALVDEAEIDSDALQAQIDVALSAAYGLVTSWMKAPAPAPAVAAADSARELEEYARRPPR